MFNNIAELLVREENAFLFQYFSISSYFPCYNVHAVRKVFI